MTSRPNRILTHERVDWPQGTVPGPGLVVEKQPPPEPRVSPADLGRTRRQHPRLWAASSPKRASGRPALQGHGGPRSPRETHPEARVPPAPAPSPGPHPQHPLSVVQMKTHHVPRLAVQAQGAPHAHGDRRRWAAGRLKPPTSGLPRPSAAVSIEYIPDG